jgi:hypothetical protein
MHSSGYVFKPEERKKIILFRRMIEQVNLELRQFGIGHVYDLNESPAM